MKNKVVYINTIFGEKIFCIILGEDKEKIYYKSEYSEGYIFKDDISDVEIIGAVDYGISGWCFELYDDELRKKINEILESEFGEIDE